MEAHARAGLEGHYFDWTMMATRQQKSFIGIAGEHLLMA